METPAKPAPILASSQDYQALIDLLNRPARSNAGLKDLYSRQVPWEMAEQAVQAKRASRKAAVKKLVHV